MNLGKFKSLIKNKALFFCRADIFSDPFEGSIPKKEIENRKKMFYDQSIYEKGFVDIRQEEKSITNIASQHARLKSCFNINCWHIDNFENDSMWQLYLKNNKGIAIQTTIESLIQSFANTQEEIYCSKVRYLNYEKDEWHDHLNYQVDEYSFLIPLVHKRIEFINENELRLIYDNKQVPESGNPQEYWETQKLKEGVNIKINLEKLIKKIYCPPTSNENNINDIKRYIEKFGYDFEVEKSILGDSPNY